MSCLGVETRNICRNIWVNINDVWGLVVDTWARLALHLWVIVTAHGNRALTCRAQSRRWRGCSSLQAFLKQSFTSWSKNCSQAKVLVTPKHLLFTFNMLLSHLSCSTPDYSGNGLKTVDWQKSYSRKWYFLTITQFIPLNFHIQATTKLKNKHVYYFIRYRECDELLLLTELSSRHQNEKLIT